MVYSALGLLCWLEVTHTAVRCTSLAGGEATLLTSLQAWDTRRILAIAADPADHRSGSHVFQVIIT